jgi:hypothetical protein
MTDLYSYQPFCNQNEKLGKLCRMGEIVIMKRKLNKLISTKEQLPLTLKPMNAKKSMFATCTVCGLFEWKQIGGDFLSFVYTSILLWIQF